MTDRANGQTLGTQASGIVLGSDARGDMYYRGASALARLAAGATVGMCLITGGASGNPSWSAALGVSTLGGVLIGAPATDPGAGNAGLAANKFLRGEYAGVGYNLVGVDTGADMVLGNATTGAVMFGSGQLRFKSASNSFAWQSASVVIGLLTSTSMIFGADDASSVAGNFSIAYARATGTNAAAPTSQLHFSRGTGTGAVGYGSVWAGVVGTTGSTAHVDTEVMRIYGGGVVIGASAPTNASVGLEVISTTKAFVPSRMTTTQRDAMTATEGMMIWNLTTHLPNFYDGAWKTVVLIAA